jgi:ferrous iron transport protein A
VTLGQRIWEALRPLGGLGWSEECPSGAPLPTEGRCGGVDCDSVRLTDLAEGARGVVSCLESPGGDAARKLAALGLLPGEVLTLEQVFPAYVVRVGYARLALDRALAGLVRVHPR